jgi:hypothetical protein
MQVFNHIDDISMACILVMVSDVQGMYTKSFESTRSR